MSQPRNRRPGAPTASITLLERALRLPRLTRIIIVALIAVATASLLDRLYPGSYYTDARNLTFMLSVGGGVIAYIIGWYLLIGFGGEENPVRRGLGIYLFTGAAFIVIVLVLTFASFVASTV